MRLRGLDLDRRTDTAQSNAMIETGFSTFLAAFVTLFIVIDPILVTPIFAGLTKTLDQKARLRIALQAAVIAAGIITLFGFVGHYVLHHLGISMAAFRTAGGVLLFIMGFRMFFDPDSETEAKTPGPKASSRESIAFFPLAIPMLSGPGAIATIMLLMGPDKTIVDKSAALVAAYLVLAISVLIMAFASRIGDALGRTGMNVITRLLGMLLMALSTQYIFDGIRTGILEQVAR
ncbi:MAG: MarC family protein [Parvularculaceae bacterium]|nr:MarC family protein [Parvularculaceae bacterium]